ncbi:apolipoprotein N-acyltransferase [Cohaesibacter sp. ES.047]|uniref:apolipoprotein N-acyltransferase n=1 Tax=Cohaesibacter sp. ES.047 TaxID=1798205 RepID=UPI000BB9A535|nr:apolipoprotein N-acyltransferase [Cohaesibacter sp. ES.047]SNY90390.1 apolipoprotein N-acyltransferase [Cohaesibacter sp. ES.047]
MPLFVSNLLLLDGWRRLAAAFIAGIIASFAQDPFGWFPLLWLSMPLLVWLLDSAALGQNTKRAAFAMARVGWMFGFGFFLCTFYWLGAAFLVEADKFAWAMPLAVVILPAGLALFWCVAAGVSALVWSTSPLRIVWLALLLAVAEYLRGTLFTGLPWGGFGPALASSGVLMQALSLVGPNTLSLFSVLLFALPVCLFQEDRFKVLGRMMVVLVLTVFVAQVAFGFYRSNLPTELAEDAPVVRLVQPNIPQTEKWKFENRSWIFNRLLALTSLDTEEHPLDAIDMVIWPESAVPFFLMEQSGALTAIKSSLPAGAGLLTGALRRNPDSPRTDEIYNSIYQLGPDGTILQAYDKVHLVPFGEYLPMQPLLDKLGLEQLTAQKIGFKVGTKRTLLDNPKLGKLLPLICYEIAFSSDILSFPKSADLIINVTNDAWFGKTIGPSQHLHIARMRAVETGLPVLRVANTGISAVIDARGKVEKQLELGAEGLIQTHVPLKLSATPYARFGNWIFFAVCVLLILTTASISRKFGKD